jgi:hypothetical protein
MVMKRLFLFPNVPDYRIWNRKAIRLVLVPHAGRRTEVAYDSETGQVPDSVSRAVRYGSASIKSPK